MIGQGLIPQTWYDVTYRCVTPTCTNYDIIHENSQGWSNAGDITQSYWCCGCNSFCEILSATYLDPQPEVS